MLATSCLLGAGTQVDQVDQVNLVNLDPRVQVYLVTFARQANNLFPRSHLNRFTNL